jgi:hypothetical protein
MNDTPETDAVSGRDPLDHVENLRTLARRLERERNNARKAAEEWRETAGSCAAMPIVEHPFSWENDPHQATASK